MDFGDRWAGLANEIALKAPLVNSQYCMITTIPLRIILLLYSVNSAEILPSAHILPILRSCKAILEQSPLRLYTVQIMSWAGKDCCTWAISLMGANMSVGFQKRINRTATHVLMKTGMTRVYLRLYTKILTVAGHVEKTNDRDYEVEERFVIQRASMKSSA